MFSNEFLKKIWKTIPPLIWAAFGWFFLCWTVMAIESIWIKMGVVQKTTMAIGLTGLVVMILIVDITPDQDPERHQA